MEKQKAEEKLMETKSQQKRSGLVYRHPLIYKFFMRILYCGSYHEKYKAVLDNIPSGSSVVDLCCGDCFLALPLAKKNCRYLGLDVNPAFLTWASARGIPAKLWNGPWEDFHEADVVCMQSSLYHFMDQAEPLVQKMLARASKKVVISEPVENMTTGGSRLLGALARRWTAVCGNQFEGRYNVETLQRLASQFKNQYRVTLKRQGRDMLLVIEK